MLKVLRAWAPVLAALSMTTFAGAAFAACCNVPTTHQVRVPGVVINRPNVTQGCSSNCGGGCQTNCGGCDSCNTPPPCNDCGGKGNYQGEFQFNAQVSASASASAAARSVSSSFANSAAYGLGGAVNGSYGYGGGGSSFYVDYNSGYIPNLAVDAGAAAISVPYSATRSMIKIVVIQAVCLDDKAIPHPASQVTPDKEIAESYEGELYRCLAGTRMQFTVADYLGKVSFDHGQTTTCEKGQALYRSAAGRVECRAQRPGRDCNERSLLRRYGAGIKILKMVWIETYTAYRTEVQQASASATAMGMVIDGGVGGIVH